MVEYIYSKTIRDYHKEIGHTYDDYEKAYLIWSSIFNRRSEIVDALKELAAGTSDEELKKEIAEVFVFEEEKLKCFKRNDDKEFLYVVFDEKRNICGTFLEYDLAMKCALSVRGYREIEKQWIADGDEEKEYVYLEYGRKALGVDTFEPDKMDDYIMSKYMFAPVSRIEIDENGKLQWIASAEYELNEELRAAYKRRFHMVSFTDYIAEIPLPEDFCTEGVKNAVTGEYGSDIDTFYGEGTGYFLRKDGFWRYIHFSISCIDEGPKPTEEPEAYRAIQTFGAWRLREVGDEELMEACRAYALRCQESPNVFEKTDVQDILIKQK